MRTFTDDQKQIHDHILLDGCVIDQRMFAGFVISLECNNHGQFSASFNPNNSPTSNLNKHKFLKVAEDYAHAAFEGGKMEAFQSPTGSAILGFTNPSPPGPSIPSPEVSTGRRVKFR